MTTPQQLLDLELPDNDSGAATVRGYLVALLAELWREEAMFTGKAPFGNSGWQYDLYVPMVRAGMAPGRFDEDDELRDFDHRQADVLIQQAIAALGEAR